MIIVVMIPIMALFIRFEGIMESYYVEVLLTYIPAIVVIRLSSFYLFGLYNRLWRYASINELVGICNAVTVSSVILFAYMYGMGSTLPLSIHLLSWFFNIGFIGVSRLVLRIVHSLRQKPAKECAKVLIIGAGDAGAMLAREINQRYSGTKQLTSLLMCGIRNGLM